MDDTEFKWVILLALAVIAAGMLWYFRADILAPPEAPAVVEPEPAAPDPVSTEPLHPIVRLENALLDTLLVALEQEKYS